MNFFHVFKFRHFPFSQQVLLKSGLLKDRINQKDKNSDAPLHVAALSGHIDVVKVLNKLHCCYCIQRTLFITKAFVTKDFPVKSNLLLERN